MGPSDVIKAFYEQVWNKRDYKIIENIIHEEYHPNDVGMPESGPALLRKEVAYFSHVFSGLKYKIADLVVQNPNKIWIYYKFTGIFANEAWGLEPTGQEANGKGIGIFTLKDGKIIDQERIYCMYDTFASTKALPPFWELSNHLDQ